MYSDRVSGVVIPFPQRVRAPAGQRVRVRAAGGWWARVLHAARAVQAGAGDAIMALLVAAMMAGDAWLLAAAFGAGR